MSEDKNKPRFQKTGVVFSTYHDIVCYYGLDTENMKQIFYYEFLNDNLPEETKTKAFQQMLEAKKMTSPYLMNILDVSTAVKPERFILITESTDSPSLREYIKTLDSPPPFKTAVRWFKSIAMAVQSLHHPPLNITHGEVSLDNAYLRSSTSSVKLLMPLVSLSLRNVSEQSINITPYQAPERIKGDHSPANDIWSLGICFLELLTGENAYSEAKTPAELIDRISELVLPEALTRVKNPSAAELIMKCLQGVLFRIGIDELLADPVFTEAEAVHAPQESAASDNVSGPIQV